jgi:tRNA (cytidine/uridine-2'-O-)-methyltransferase
LESKIQEREDKSANLNIVLVEPEIPPNTGNVARLCAAINADLHLVGTLGFKLTDRYLRRAGLDYWDHVSLKRHSSVDGFFSAVPSDRIFLFSKKGSRCFTDVEYRKSDYLVFGSETRGLSENLLSQFSERVVTIPIFNENVRSLNLSSCVATAAYEALRQIGFDCWKWQATTGRKTYD